MIQIRRFSCLAMLVVIVAALPSAVEAQKNSTIPVTTTFSDIGASDVPLRVKSDGKGAYVTKTVNRTVQVQSSLLVFSNGTDWTVTTYYTAKGTYVASDRTVFFDLREQVAAGAFATPTLGTDANGQPVPYGYATAHLIAKCSQVNVDMTKMAQGASVECPGSLRFRALDGLWYRLSFAPANFAQVDPFLVTCTRADGTGCKVWTIAPSASTVTGYTDPNPKSLNTLLHIDEGGNILAVGGDYYVSFSFTVAR